MKEILQIYGKELVALVVPVIAWALSYLFKANAKLVVAVPHRFVFLVQEPLRDANGNVIRTTQTANTQHFLVRNSGRATATRVELAFNWKPPCINIFPPRHFEEHVEPDMRYTLIFDSLAPGEFIGCYLMSINVELPLMMTARCDQCNGKEIQMYPQPQLQTWRRNVASFLMFVGAVASIYALILLLQFVILATPFGHTPGAI